ncbi:MAG TPA: DNA-binding response regulator [Desulfotomaculum sp.]|nr:MAG: Fis family transcriptional regulator [Peptococcaceae bacterium BRH_c8a]KJS73626.1 MAG: Fis family transcriptional regulator [Desulfotomaculum sp. BICA1-6]HBX23058.1 DNA-binding response regulator [Desulfotomaculum sp.]
MKHKTILIVDDEPRLLRLVKVNLLASGYEVATATDGKTAIELIEASDYDLLILDIMLPGQLNGFEVCKRIREFSDIPVIMLTGRAREQDRIRGFDVGADDYLTKPFSVEELLRRIKAVLRRTYQAGESPKCPTYTAGDLVINFAQRRVFVEGKEVKLTATEYEVLYHLGSNAGKIITHEDLLTWVWGLEYRNELHYLRNYISSLRKKIEDDPANPKYILGKHGIGYQLTTE